MAAFQHFTNMHDFDLKPRLLRSLLKDQVPDEKRPFGSLSDLPRVINLVQTHKLLSESFAETIEEKQIQRWKSSVDEWVERVLALVTSNSPDKCWAGICLLWVTTQECSSDRFLTSYTIWFERLLLHIQQPVDSRFVKVASCNSIWDMITRLGRSPNSRKDGTSLAFKIMLPILKLLNEDSSEAVWEAAVHLLCTIITCFPAAVQRHYDSAEAAIAFKILSRKCSADMLKKFACCLALLPKSRGDEGSWFIMMQKILLLVNSQLSDIFQGLEEESRRNEAVKLLVPPGKDPPPPLGGGPRLSAKGSLNATKRSEDLVISCISALMHSCCEMLTSPYPALVNVPISSLLALVERVLMVDGSLSRNMLLFMTAMQQELICAELPVLHLSSLELLISIIKGMRSQLLPHAAYILRLIKEYFKRYVLPDLRVKLYSITEVLLRSMGIGIAIYLAQEVVKNAFADLSPIDDENICTSSNANANTSSETLVNHIHRKRRHGATESLEKQQIEMETSKNHSTTPISVKVAALKALKAPLTEAGAFKSEPWRSEVDILLINIAATSCKGGWARYGEKSSTWADLQLVALQALLASLLSPSRIRPPHLAQGIELFRRGKQEIGTKLSEFCADALLDLEVLIHPRALPLADFSSAHGKSFDATNGRLYDTTGPGAYEYSIALPSGMQEIGNGSPETDDDNLYHSWLEISNEMEATLNVQDENMDIMNRTVTLTVDHVAQPLVVGSSSMKIPGRNEGELSKASADAAMRRKEDELIVTSQQLQDSMVHSQEPMSFKGGTTPIFTGDGKAPAMGFTRMMTSDNDLNYKEDEMDSTGEDTSAPGDNIFSKDYGFVLAGKDTFTKLSVALKGINT